MNDHRIMYYKPVNREDELGLEDYGVKKQSCAPETNIILNVNCN